ncbi:MAG TPA: hypothetical protein DEA28_02765 [Firmicutes bacterium]|nr:hypothetical protein [Bacillota bacterium]
MEILELFYKSKSGDINCQAKLLECCKSASLPLTLKYLKIANKLGLSYDDLRNLNVAAFYKVLLNFDEERAEFIEYFKYIYLMTLRDSLRDVYRKMGKDYNLLSIDNIDGNYTLQFNSTELVEESSKYSKYEEKEIYDYVINKRKVKLTNVEYEITKLFLDGMSVKEIANYRNRNYTETFRTLKRAIQKIRRAILETEI